MFNATSFKYLPMSVKSVLLNFFCPFCSINSWNLWKKTEFCPGWQPYKPARTPTSGRRAGFHRFQTRFRCTKYLHRFLQMYLQMLNFLDVFFLHVDGVQHHSVGCEEKKSKTSLESTQKGQLMLCSGDDASCPWCFKMKSNLANNWYF